MQNLLTPFPTVQEEEQAPPAETIPNLLPAKLPGSGSDHSEHFSWIQPVMSWNDHLVIDRYGPPLPVERCCECNDEADHTVVRSYSSHSYGVILAMLLLPLLIPFVLLAHFLFKSRAMVEFGECRACRARRKGRLLAGLVALGGSIFLYVQAARLDGNIAILCLLGGIVTLLVGAILVARARCFGWSRRVDERWVILKAGSSDFHKSLPRSPIPQF